MVRNALISAALVAATLSACGGGTGAGNREEGEAAAGAPFSTAGWETDFSRHSVPLDEFVGGGPPKDGIPSIDDPKFVAVNEADAFLDPREPVAVVELGHSTHAYPLQVLVWHEIVNDEIAGDAVAVTYCPLCNSTVAFRREIDGRPVEFGTTGMLRNSDLVMYDRQSESWWQQITAEAVVGELTGERLEVLPSQILSWKQVQRLHPAAEVLSRDTGFERDYGTNPYTGYDADPESQPFLFDGEPDHSPRSAPASGPRWCTPSRGSPKTRRSRTRSATVRSSSSSIRESPRRSTAHRSPGAVMSVRRPFSSGPRAGVRSASNPGPSPASFGTPRPARGGA
jgi:Protein of unknown function (DUF3179)